MGGGGPMPLPAGGVPNQFAMGANMSSQGSSGGSAGRAGEERELQSAQDYRPAMDLHPLADDVHLEHVSGMGLPSASSAPYLHTLEAFHPSAPLILPREFVPEPSLSEVIDLLPILSQRTATASTAETSQRTFPQASSAPNAVRPAHRLVAVTRGASHVRCYLEGFKLITVPSS